MPLYLQIIVALLAGFLAWHLGKINFLRRVAARAKANEQSRDRILLQIRVKKDNEYGPQVAEQMFAAIHSIYQPKKWKNWYQGTDAQERISFEIASIGGNLLFFVWVPRTLQSFIESQIYAQYPEVEINEADDYSILPEDQVGAFTELKFTNNNIFPIRRTKEFADKEGEGSFIDPLSGITATLNNISNKGDQAWAQIVISPASNDWQKKAVKFIENMTAGKGGLEVAKKINPLVTLFKFIFWPLRIIISGLKLIAGASGGGSSPESKGGAMSESDKGIVKAVTEKSTKLGFEVSIRLGYVSKSENINASKLTAHSLFGGFKQFNLVHLNGFEASTPKKKKTPKLQEFFPFLSDFDFMKRKSTQAEMQSDYQSRKLSTKMIMNIEELASVFHLPNISVKTPNIVWVTAKKVEAPTDLPFLGDDPAEDKDITLIGKTNFRSTQKKFGILPNDRRRHIYIIGKTGMGKSVLLENMIKSDIENGKGVCVVDPHGELADNTLSFVPKWRTNDVVLFDASDRDHPVGFNMMDVADPHYHTLAADGITAVIKRMFIDSWGPRLEYILRHCCTALIENQDTTMLGILRMLTDEIYRDQIVENVKDPVCREFWETEFPQWTKNDKDFQTVIGPIQNKVGQFLASPIARNILGQVKTTIDLRDIMDNKKILICNLSKGKIGDINMNLLGSLLINKIQLEAMSRSRLDEDERIDFYLYVDEFQNFMTDSFAVILSEARKYKLNLCMANQYIAQMSDTVREAVFGNVGTLISFQVGFDDGTYFSNQFGELISEADLADLGVGSIYIRLMVRNMPTRVFSARTMLPPKTPDNKELIKKVREVSHERYSTSREIIEDKINRWSAGAKENASKAKGKERQKQRDISAKDLAKKRASGMAPPPSQKKYGQSGDAPAAPKPAYSSKYIQAKPSTDTPVTDKASEEKAAPEKPKFAFELPKDKKIVAGRINPDKK